MGAGFSRPFCLWITTCSGHDVRSDYPHHLNPAHYRGLRRYFLTYCTDFRRRLFIDSAVVDLVWSQILRAAQQHHFDVIAYCFMPDHLHLLVEATAETCDCLAFVRKAKQYSGFYFSKIHGQRLWQPYGYEHILRDDQATLEVARYIFANPGRAGLVANAEEYAFLGSSKYSVREILEAIADTKSG